jgi:hypothetical protein
MTGSYHKLPRIEVLVGMDTGMGLRIGYTNTLFPQKHQYGDTDTIFLIKIKT